MSDLSILASRLHGPSCVALALALAACSGSADDPWGTPEGQDGGSGEADDGHSNPGDATTGGDGPGDDRGDDDDPGDAETGDAADSGDDGDDQGNGDDSGDPPVPPEDAVVIGYFSSWSVYDRDVHLNQVPVDKLTHINYAFANIQDGRCVLGDAYADTDKFYEGDSWDAGALRGNFNQLLKLKQAHPHLRTLISIGGWTWSSAFSSIAASESARATFVESCVDFMLEYGFDGIDVDWEFPVGGGLETNDNQPEDKQNYTLLLQDFRDALEVAGAGREESYLLTIAAPADAGRLENYELAEQAQILDWTNLMAYDFRGAWAPLTGHHAPLYTSDQDLTEEGPEFCVSSGVEVLKAAGVPRSKIVVGIPFYGRGWQGAEAQNNGLYVSASSTPPTGTWEPGNFDYQDLMDNYLPSFERLWDDVAMVPWLYQASTGMVITYEDPESIQGKADYILEEGVRGSMFWELSNDPQFELLDTLGTAMGR